MGAPTYRKDGQSAWSGQFLHSSYSGCSGAVSQGPNTHTTLVKSYPRVCICPGDSIYTSTPPFPARISAKKRHFSAVRVKHLYSVEVGCALARSLFRMKAITGLLLETEQGGRFHLQTCDKPSTGMLGVLDDDGTVAAVTQCTTRAPPALSRAIHYKLLRIAVLGVEQRLVCAIVHIGTSKGVPPDAARGMGP